MANLPGLSAVVRGLDVPGRKLIPNRTPRKVISPIAYFMANSGLDLRFTLNCRRAAWRWPVRIECVPNSPAHREQLLGNLTRRD